MRRQILDHVALNAAAYHAVVFAIDLHDLHARLDAGIL